MGMRAVADAMARLERVLERKPEAGVSDDAPACAAWAGSSNALRVNCRHPNGREVSTDLAEALGGSGDQVSPGWLYRAGLASCATTSIVLFAATEGIALTRLEVEATSRSDARGLLGMQDADAILVDPAPIEQCLTVRVTAEGVEHAALDQLIRRALARSPIPRAVGHAGELEIRIEVA